jgi:hypothetical protein
LINISGEVREQNGELTGRVNLCCSLDPTFKERVTEL